jgi:hypothetical protein
MYSISVLWILYIEKNCKIISYIILFVRQIFQWVTVGMIRFSRNAQPLLNGNSYQLIYDVQERYFSSFSKSMNESDEKKSYLTDRAKHEWIFLSFSLWCSCMIKFDLLWMLKKERNKHRNNSCKSNVYSPFFIG